MTVRWEEDKVNVRNKLKDKMVSVAFLLSSLKQQEMGSLCVAQSGPQWLFSGAVSLLIITGVLRCSISSWLVHPSLGNLVVAPPSQEVNILMLNLVQTPEGYNTAAKDSRAQASSCLSSPSS